MATGQQKCRVYGLVSSDEPNRIRYVGQTKRSLGRRLILHRYQAKNVMKNTPVGRWIQSEKERGNEIQIVCIVEDAIWNKTEIEVIARFKDLLNRTKGGQGHYGSPQTALHKSRIRSALIGKKKSKQHAENIRKAKIGFRHSEAVKMAMGWHTVGVSPVNKGKKMTRQERIEISRLRGGTSILVLQKDTMKKVGIWPSISICSQELGVHRNSIGNVLAGRANFAGDYVMKRVGV